MPDKRIQDEEPPNLTEQDRQTDNEVLLCLLSGASWPWTLQELAREIADEIGAADSVARLVRQGFLHRSGEFVFPTRTARRAFYLQLGTV